MVFDRMKQDPEIILSKMESKEYFQKFGRFPTYEQLSDYQAGKARRAQIDAADRAAQEEAKQVELDKARRKREEERKMVVSDRIASRDKRPNDYEPPRTLEQLLVRTSAGESYFSGAKVSFLTDDRSLVLDFEGCNFTGATLTDIRLFKGSTFENIVAQGAAFRDCIFYSGSNISKADLKDAQFKDTVVEQSAKVTETSFEGATFDRKCAVTFDQNYVLRSNFKDVSSDWVKIYTTFTGIQQFINIALCFGYFLLLFGKIFLLSTLAEAQTRILSDPSSSALIGGALLLEGGTPVWQMAFGGATPTVFSAIVAVLILIYQIERYRLTNAFAPMIDDQKTDGITPRAGSYLFLKKRFDRNFYLGLIALAVFLIDLFFALVSVVYPPNPEFWAGFSDQLRAPVTE